MLLPGHWHTTDTRSGGRHFGLCAGPPVADQQYPLNCLSTEPDEAKAPWKESRDGNKRRNNRKRQQWRKKTSPPSHSSLPTSGCVGWAGLRCARPKHQIGLRRIEGGDFWTLFVFSWGSIGQEDLLFMNFLFSDQVPPLDHHREYCCRRAVGFTRRVTIYLVSPSGAREWSSQSRCGRR